MIIQRDNSPEQLPGREQTLVRSEVVAASVAAGLTALCTEFAAVWSAPERSLNAAGEIIDHTFMETQGLEIDPSQSVSEAERRVMEAIDEFSA
ncbi:MAG TPA: hypothetical protein VFH99_01890 [Candidatus Saccharimonadales bacterium]|nr:hypothetical protein [Candidatus Saccharimonadales bacterium]